jgi:hypothetical protein
MNRVELWSKLRDGSFRDIMEEEKYNMHSNVRLNAVCDQGSLVASTGRLSLYRLHGVCTYYIFFFLDYYGRTRERESVAP